MAKNRILSKDGATILIAILFFLMCSVVGSIVLAAGTASSGRIANLSEQEQTYYTVTSAAKTIRDNIGRNTTVTLADTESNSTITGDGNFNSIIKKAAFNVKSDGTAYTDTLTVNVSGPQNGSEKVDFDTVEIEFTMDTDYTISMVFKQKDSNDDTYVCTLLLNGYDNVIDEDNNIVHVIWGELGTINKGAL